MRRDDLRIQDMLLSITRIESYISGIEYNSLENDNMRKSAIMAELTTIGEAAKNISQELKKKHSEVEWSKAASLRNVLVHEYFGIEWEILWNTITKDLPELKKQLNKII